MFTFLKSHSKCIFFYLDDPVLSEYQVAEDNDGTTVYYTILEDIPDSIEDPNVLSLDSNELLTDNVLYLSINNEQDSNTVDSEDIEEIKPSLTFSESGFEEITLPNGTRAYLKNEPKIGK